MTSTFIPASNEPSDCLQAFGDCREGCCVPVAHVKRRPVHNVQWTLALNRLKWNGEAERRPNTPSLAAESLICKFFASIKLSCLHFGQ